MNALLDIIVVLLMIIPIVTAWKRGFIKTVTKSVCVILAIILAVNLTPAITEQIDDTSIKESLDESIYETVSSLVPDGVTPGEEAAQVGSKLNEYLKTVGIDIDSIKAEAEADVEEFALNISQEISEKVVYCICFVLLFARKNDCFTSKVQQCIYENFPGYCLCTHGWYR